MQYIISRRDSVWKYGVLTDEDLIIGTGCYDGNHITGVYVLPDYQKQGCGSKIIKYQIMLNWFTKLWKRN